MSRFSPRRLLSRLTLALLLATPALAGGPSHPSDVAGAIGFLLRVQDGVCPGISFDPFVMSKMIDPKGLPVEAVKHRFRKDFSHGYEQAGSRIETDGAAGYCELVRYFFGKTTGEFPGLTVQ